MRSVLFFTVIASSLLAVFPLPMHISNQALTAGPSNQLHPEAIVRLIDGKTGEDLGSNVVAPAVIKGPTAALRSIFGKGSKVTFIGKYVPGQIRIYFRVIGPLGCDDKDNPCFGWMAKGPRYKLVPARPNGNGDIIESYARVNMPLDLWYVGLSSGRPALGHFDNRERGKPQAVPATVRDPKITEKMKLSWVQLLDEYKKSFMIPEVTFTTLPQSAFYVSRPEKDPKRKPKKEPKEELREELKKELNEALYVAGLKYGALHWPKDGSILYHGRYGTEVHDPNEPNLRWFFFRIAGGHKRCPSVRPCMGCIVRKSGTIYALIAQEKSGLDSPNGAQLDVIAIYPVWTNQMHSAMMMQLQHRRLWTWEEIDGIDLWAVVPVFDLSGLVAVNHG